MNALVIGRCPKSAQQLSTFCEKVFILLDSSFPRERNMPELAEFTLMHSDVNCSKASGIFKRSFELIKYVNNYRIDIVFSNTKWDMVAARIASLFTRHKVKLLATNHNSYAWLEDKNVNRMAFLIRHSVDGYVALSSFVRDKLIVRGVPANRIVLVPNTIAPSVWKCKSDYSKHSPFRLVYVAYVCEGKRQDFIADVMDLIMDRYPVEVDCYGEVDEFKDYVESIKAKVERFGLYDNFHLCGPVDNAYLRNNLYGYDAYFCASQMEMSPVNILEAQAAGLPVVAPRIGGIPDLIEDNSNGLLFDVNSPQDAALKIMQLIDDESLRMRIGKEGRRYVSEVYTTTDAGLLIQRLLYK